MSAEGDVQSGINGLRLALANKRNELKRIQNQIQEFQDTLNKLVEPKLERVTKDHQTKSGKNAEYDSLVKSKENYRSQIMKEHSATLSKLKATEERIENRRNDIQTKKIATIQGPRFWFEKSRRDCELTLKLNQVSGDTDAGEKMKDDFEAKEAKVEELKKKLQEAKEKSIAIRNRNDTSEAPMKEKPTKNLENEISRAQVISLDLDEREERLTMRERLAKKNNNKE